MVQSTCDCVLLCRNEPATILHDRLCVRITISVLLSLLLYYVIYSIFMRRSLVMKMVCYGIQINVLFSWKVPFTVEEATI